MTTRSIYGQNSIITFFRICLAIREQRMGTKPFRVLLVSSSPTNGKNMNAIDD